MEVSELIRIKAENAFLMCPHCKEKTKSNNGAEYCGNNLRCNRCGTYSHRKDYTIK
jgi:hypothetical protein